MAKFLSILLAALPLSFALPTTPRYPEFDPSDIRPLVESNKLCRTLTRSRLLHHAGYFQDFAVESGDWNRGFGGIGHNATVGYLFDEISKLSEWYDVYLQPFSERYSAATGSFVVDGDAVAFYAARGSPSVKSLKAELGAAKGEGCNTWDFGPGLAGKIVLLQRGNCTITLKTQLGKAAGAAAVVVYNVSILFPKFQAKWVHLLIFINRVSLELCLTVVFSMFQTLSPQVPWEWMQVWTL